MTEINDLPNDDSPIGDIFDEIDDAATPRDEDLQALFNNLGDEDANASLRVYRLIKNGPNRGKEGILFTIPITECNSDSLLEKLLAEFGDGCYRVRAYASHGQGRLKFQRDLIVGDGIEKTRPPTTSPTVDGGQSQAIDRLAMMMERVLEKISEPREQKSTSDFLKELALMKDLFATPPQPSPFETLRDAMALKDMLKEDSAPTGGFDLMAKALEALAPAFQRAAEESAAAKTVQPVLPNPTPAPVPVKPKTAEEYPVDLKFYMPMAMQMAERGAPVADVANLMLEHATDAHVDAIAELVDGENPLQEIIKIWPDAERHRTWLADLLRALHNALYEPDDEESPVSDPPLSPHLLKNGEIVINDADNTGNAAPTGATANSADDSSKQPDDAPATSDP